MLMSWRHVSKSSSQKQYGCGVSPIINRLSRIYDKVTMYETRNISGLYKKTCFYYGGMSLMQEVGDPEVAAASRVNPKAIQKALLKHPMR